MAKAEQRGGQAALEPFLAGLVLLVGMSLIWGGMGYTAHPQPSSLKCSKAAVFIQGIMQTLCCTDGWDRMSDK